MEEHFDTWVSHESDRPVQCKFCGGLATSYMEDIPLCDDCRCGFENSIGAVCRECGHLFVTLRTRDAAEALARCFDNPAEIMKTIEGGLVLLKVPWCENCCTKGNA